MSVQALNMRAYLAGTLALDLSPTLTSPEYRARIGAIRHALTLERKYKEDESPWFAMWSEEPGWLHVPRGWLMTPDGQRLLAGFEIQDGRSGGYALPPATRVAAVLGAPPHPPGQPAFVSQIVAACQANGHGGIALAPTRAGKTLCSLEAAARLGGSTLILVDRGALLNQWVEVIQGKHGLGIKAGIIQQDRFDTPPEFPFVVGMVETLARRQFPEEFRQAFRTVILDECQGAPTAMTWLTLKRVAPSYVIGLTATPDRKDGLTDAVFWTTGPVIAELARPLEADVHFLQLAFEHAEVEGKRPRMIRPNGMMNIVGVEQSLYSDPVRVARLSNEAIMAKNGGRRVLIFVALREHVRLLRTAIKAQGYDPGIFIGGQDDLAAMKRDICITTFGMASKGIDFQPPFTLCILAAPRADVRQAMGRVLNPQAPHKPMILDVVDGHKALIGLARARARLYHERGFVFRNSVWPDTDGGVR